MNLYPYWRNSDDEPVVPLLSGFYEAVCLLQVQYGEDRNRRRSLGERIYALKSCSRSRQERPEKTLARGERRHFCKTREERDVSHD